MLFSVLMKKAKKTVAEESRDGNITKKRTPAILLILLSIATIIAAIIAAVVIENAVRPTSIGLYGMPKNVAEAIKACANDPKISGKAKYNIIEIDESLSPSVLINQKNSRYDILMGYGGAGFEQASGALLPLGDMEALRMPLTLRALGSVEGKRYALPLLLDHFEIAYDRNAFLDFSLGAPETYAEYSFAAEKLVRKGQASVLVAGGEDEELLLFVSALVEAKGGATAYEKLVAALSTTADFKSVLDVPLGKDLSLRSVLDSLTKMRAGKILHPEWFRMKRIDILSFMDRGQAPMVLMTLSSHRTVPIKTIQNYISLPFPSDRPRQERSLVAPALVGSIAKKTKRAIESSRFLDALTDVYGQKLIADSTGLAPSNSQVETLDVQASDLRYWVATAKAATSGLGRDSQTTSQARTGLARAIRNHIEAGGIGD
jgi:ABC-type glycerol-3-phosphate transport system substrate-binding protein